MVLSEGFAQLCVCNSVEVRLALACHSFAGVTCRQLFIQAAIPCVAHERRGLGASTECICPHTETQSGNVGSVVCVTVL